MNVRTALIKLSLRKKLPIKSQEVQTNIRTQQEAKYSGSLRTGQLGEK